MASVSEVYYLPDSEAMQSGTRVGKLRINVLSVTSGLYSKPYSEEVSSMLLRNAGTVYQIIRRYFQQDIKINCLFINVKISNLACIFLVQDIVL